jgi:hypothetical protein
VYSARTGRTCWSFLKSRTKRRLAGVDIASWCGGLGAAVRFTALLLHFVAVYLAAARDAQSRRVYVYIYACVSVSVCVRAGRGRWTRVAGDLAVAE